MGFCVAKTVKNCESGWAMPSMVIWCSSMASSTAAWVRGGMRLTSSASRRSVNSGPRWSEKVLVERLSTLLPMMSAGMRSEVHWTRRNSRSKSRAKLLTTSVLAIPGTPSSSAWPPHRMVSRHWLMRSSWPTMTLASSLRPCVSTCETVCMCGGLLCCERNELQILGAQGQLLRQLQRAFLGKLRAAQGIFNLLEKFVELGVRAAQPARQGAGKLGGRNVRADAELAGGNGAKPGIRHGQRRVRCMGAMIKPAERVHKFERRKARRLRQRMDRAVAARESEDQRNKDERTLQRAENNGLLEEVALEEGALVAVEVFVPEDLNIGGRAQRVEQQREIAGFVDPGVGQGRTCRPPDHLAAADLVRDDDGPRFVGVMNKDSGGRVLPVSAGRHLDCPAAGERRKQLRLVLPPTGRRHGFVFRIGLRQEKPRVRAAGQDFSTMAEVELQGILLLRRREARRAGQHQHGVGGFRGKLGGRLLPAFDAVAQVFQQQIRGFSAAALRRVGAGHEGFLILLGEKGEHHDDR